MTTPREAMIGKALLTSDDSLDTAFEWLCQRRKDYPDSADIWHFRAHANRIYEQERRGILSSLGAYVRRFVGWSQGGLKGILDRPPMELLAWIELGERGRLLGTMIKSKHSYQSGSE